LAVRFGTWSPPSGSNKAERPSRIFCDLHLLGEGRQALARRSTIIAGIVNLNTAFEGQTV
jgi:hypothetical protein